MNREWHVLIYLKGNINKQENFSFPGVKSHIDRYFSIYWRLLQSYITCILRIKYITWHKTKKSGISMTVYSYNGQWVSEMIIIHS